MQTTINNIIVKIEGTLLQVDVKSFLKLFKSGNLYISKFKETFPSIEAENTPRQPMWINIKDLEVVFDKFRNSEMIVSEFDLKNFLDQSFDWAYGLGLTEYKSTKKIAEEAAEEVERIETERGELIRLREFVEQMKEREKVGINPAIAFLNDVWFPVLLSGVFACVIGNFSYEILSETMGMSPAMNVLLAVVYVLFPILTSIRQYQFDFFGEKVSPLIVVMVADMIFTAYHVGWFRGDDYHTSIELHPVLKMVYVTIIPLFQKATNDMILKIRASYLAKGWLPKV